MLAGPSCFTVALSGSRAGWQRGPGSLGPAGRKSPGLTPQTVGQRTTVAQGASVKTAQPKAARGGGVATKVGWRIRWEGARQVAGQPGCLVHPVGGCTCARETEALGWAISLDVTCFSPWEEGWVLMDLWRPDSRCLSCPPRVPSCTTFLWFPCNGCGQVSHSVQQQVGEATCVSFRLAQSCLRSLFP